MPSFFLLKILQIEIFVDTIYKNMFGTGDKNVCIYKRKFRRKIK